MGVSFSLSLSLSLLLPLFSFLLCVVFAVTTVEAGRSQSSSLETFAIWLPEESGEREVMCARWQSEIIVYQRKEEEARREEKK